MREIRPSGSEGGVALTPPSLPLSQIESSVSRVREPALYRRKAARLNQLTAIRRDVSLPDGSFARIPETRQRSAAKGEGNHPRRSPRAPRAKFPGRPARRARRFRMAEG